MHTLCFFCFVLFLCNSRCLVLYTFHVASGPPSNVRATVLTPRSIRVSWDEVTAADVTGYRILYTTTAEYISPSSEMMTVDDSDITSITFTGLEEATLYRISLESKIGTEFSIPSDVVPVTTWTDGKGFIILYEESSCYNPTVPSARPQSVIVTSVNPSSLMVSWQTIPEIDHNGQLDYVIEYTRSGTLRNMVTVDGSVTAHTIPELVPFVEYSVRVAGMTVNGTGQYSNFIRRMSGEDGESMIMFLLLNFDPFETVQFVTFVFKFVALECTCIRIRLCHVILNRCWLLHCICFLSK